ncbi:response regulator [Paenibacillus sp. ACRRX]|uniref:response regulator n=1 Tax=unclassified Paenibacillus TaxID=185978 RepID=UPI001EF64D2B|nr:MULTISPECIES: response regulator [unclassified Paenibacillus]MCG7406853.1 response regulator [Paenibacillus sp. ACRRX]MDK8179786.1 response regulator [Paenibacillus sp. UMB4589-SE434]
MKIMIVDDEKLALRSMSHHLKEFTDVEIVGMFNDPREALKLAGNEHIDLVFLDIEMPEINGMVLAERLMEQQSHIRIVFVTAYSEYAIQAFELNAMDYLLKPVQRSRIAVTLQRSNDQLAKAAANKPGSNFQLCCMHSLYLRDDEGQSHSFQWRTLKAQELFAYLLHNRGQTVRKESILEWMWSDCEPDKASNLLHTTIYQIRRVLKLKGVDVHIKYADSGYRLETNAVLFDVETWEQELNATLPVSPHNLDHQHQLLAQYRGDYLGEYDYIWAESERERLRTLWLIRAQQVALCHREQLQHVEALQVYLLMLEKYPYNEEIWFEAMKLQAELGNTYEVKKIFDKLTSNLMHELGLKPSPNIQDWYGSFVTRM